MTDIRKVIERAHRHANAPAIIDTVASENDHDDLADVAAEVEIVLREECQKRDLDKHAGCAICYLVVDRLAEIDDDE